MNPSQRQSILDVIDVFFSTESQSLFEETMSNKYKDGLPENEYFLDYSVPDLLALAKRISKSIEIRLNSEDWQLLPFNNIPDQSPQTNLQSLLQIIVVHLKNANYRDVAKPLRSLVRYQMDNGFYGNSNKNTITSTADIESKSIQISEKLKSIDALKKDIMDVKASINEELKKQGDLKKQIQDNVKLANDSVLKISGIQKNTQTLEQSITDANTRCSNLITALQNKENELQEKQKTISEHIDKTEAFMDSSKAVFGDIAKNRSEAEGHLADIKKMMGYIADGTLSHSFNMRKQRISKKVTFWLITSLVTLILTIFWICVVFTYLKANTGMIWADILINVIKSSLMVFAFGYSLNEYNKERTLYEEYAFRESVAVTLTAYLQQLESCSKEEMQKLLMDTVEKLYTKPIISTKEYKFSKLDAESIAELVKPIAQSINELKK